MTAPTPEACPNPCRECPWRRESAAGWLGPFDADEWVMIAHGDERVACHLTIGTSPDGTESREEAEALWAEPRIRQCAGAAIYRANVAKRPRDRRAAIGTPDRDAVFATPVEFKAHHERKSA